MCPYARFQSALIDKDSLVIAYDSGRGEARGSRSRKADPKALGLGDCIDCTLCVQVCPTGIDIRNGLQNECIGCAACIDVCDDVMGKMGYAPGLIRYSTENGVAHGWSRAQMLRRTLRPRVLIYGLGLLVVAGLFVFSLSQRSGFTVDVIKDRASLARVVEDGVIENSFRLQIANGTEHGRRFRISVQGLPGLRIVTPAEVAVEGTRIRLMPVTVALAPQAAEAYRGHAHPIVFEITALDAPPGSRLEKSTYFVPR
jgi:cytochrome c oxidase accessory protein FixG